MVLKMTEEEMRKVVADVNFKKMGGLVPVVVQDGSNDNVLMQAFMNEEALRLTLQSGKMHYWSRTKNRIWMKGETSGNVSLVQKVALDCDSDSLLFTVQQIGPCCHTGKNTCFHKNSADTSKDVDARVLERIFEVVNERASNPKGQSYVSTLTGKGVDYILQKVGEEAFEFVIAAGKRSEKETVSEASDLLFHMLVLFAAKQMDFRDCFKELQNRHYTRTQPVHVT
jgi:phosphoribosyl-ATP pyrophosphohydrolase/phosphoribosyl-AMP cyclohydrolase